MTGSLRRDMRRGRGETLLEMVLAIFLMGAAGLVFLGTLAAAMVYADHRKTEAGARDLVSTVGELANADNPRFTPCATTTDYQPAVDALAQAPYKLTVVEVARWTGSQFTTDGACDPNSQRLQRITIRADGPGGTAQQVVVTKSSDRTDSGVLVAAQTAPGATVGDFTLQVGSPATAANPTGGVRFAVFAPTDANCQAPLWQTLAQPSAAGANPAVGSAIAPAAPLPAVGDSTFTARQANVTLPLFTIAAAYGNQPGTYRWRATYLGDAASQPSVTNCGGTGREIPMAPTTITLPEVTVQQGGAALYQPVLASADAVPGAVTFTVHGVTPGAPGDPCVTGTAVQLPPAEPDPAGVVHQTVDERAYGHFGDYRVTVDYPGDPAHLPEHQSCPQGSLLHVQAASALSLAETAGPTGPALLATTPQGWVTPPGQNAGMVTFTVYSTPTCQTPLPGVTAVAPMVNGAATTTFAGLAPANYWAGAVWTGDARNVASTAQCVPFPVVGASGPGMAPAPPLAAPGMHPVGAAPPATRREGPGTEWA
jgi:hypothetical protein